MTDIGLVQNLNRKLNQDIYLKDLSLCVVAEYCNDKDPNKKRIKIKIQIDTYGSGCHCHGFYLKINLASDEAAIRVPGAGVNAYTKAAEHLLQHVRNLAIKELNLYDLEWQKYFTLQIKLDKHLFEYSRDQVRREIHRDALSDSLTPERLKILSRWGHLAAKPIDMHKYSYNVQFYWKNHLDKPSKMKVFRNKICTKLDNFLCGLLGFKVNK